MYYILDADKNPVLIDHKNHDELRSYGEWMSNWDNKVVEQADVDDLFVSTVFLGVIHFDRDLTRQVLFESMVFLNDESVHCERYVTFDEAKAGHAALLDRVRGEIGKHAQFLAENEGRFLRVLDYTDRYDPELTPEMIEWLEQNTRAEVVEFELYGEYLLFPNPEDAFAFRMRWK